MRSQQKIQNFLSPNKTTKFKPAKPKPALEVVE